MTGLAGPDEDSGVAAALPRLATTFEGHARDLAAASGFAGVSGSFGEESGGTCAGKSRFCFGCGTASGWRPKARRWAVPDPPTLCEMQFSQREAFLVGAFQRLPPAAATELSALAERLAERAPNPRIDWSDSWSDEDLNDFKAASMRRP